MTIRRPPSRSVFRPAGPIDRTVLDEHADVVADIERRGVLRGAVSLGALALLSGCRIDDKPGVERALLAVSRWNDRVQEAIFRPDHLAPTSPRRGC